MVLRCVAVDVPQMAIEESHFKWVAKNRKGGALESHYNYSHKSNAVWWIDFISAFEYRHCFFKKDYFPSLEEIRKYNKGLLACDDDI